MERPVGLRAQGCDGGHAASRVTLVVGTPARLRLPEAQKAVPVAMAQRRVGTNRRSIWHSQQMSAKYCLSLSSMQHAPVPH